MERNTLTSEVVSVVDADAILRRVDITLVTAIALVGRAPHAIPDLGRHDCPKSERDSRDRDSHQNLKTSVHFCAPFSHIVYLLTNVAQPRL